MTWKKGEVHARATGERNPRWNGGRSVTSHGYVLVRVGKTHHLSHGTGYAYEHRLVAERKIGRKLRADELVHHINGKRTDNRPENIEVVRSQAHHFVHHRGKNSRLRHPDEPNPWVRCDCGCGTRFRKYDTHGRPRRLAWGHNIYESKPWLAK